MHTHSKIGKLIWFLIIFFIIVTGYFFYRMQSSYNLRDVVKNEDGVKNGISSYQNYLYNFKFKYSTDLYLKERKVGTSNKPQLSIVMVEGTKENIDLIEGRSTDVREGPVNITLDVYQNENELSPTEWARQDTNWNIGSKTTSSIGVAGEPGVFYSWSGLYEGESIIITKGKFAYVFSVTWMGPEDKILRYFDGLLKSFSFIK